MGFKTGKRNAYAVLQARCNELQRALDHERTVKPMLQEFARRLGDAMLTKLAYTPYTQWPQWAKNTFAWVATDMPTAAYMYKDALPKE